MIYKNNQKLADIFKEIAAFLAMDNVAFKPAAYSKAAAVLVSLEEDIEEIYSRGGQKSLEDLPGIGKGLAEKAVEFLETGKVKYYEKLKTKKPINWQELLLVEGLGPKKIKKLYEKLRITNLTELEQAARQGKIAPLFGFGEKTQSNILEAIEFVKRSSGRFLLGEILPFVEEIETRLRGFKGVKELFVAGSIRRRKETIGDVDFLASSARPQELTDFFVSLPEAVKVWSKGPAKASVRMSQGFDADLRIISPRSFGAALQYFTGSKEHNIAIRKAAIDKGMKLNEYGLFKGSEMVAGGNEKDIYKALDMAWPEPELRENRGEVEAALKNELPCLVRKTDLKGDLHCHSSWNGGANTIEEMAQKAIELGYCYLGISDHTKFLKIENGLDEKGLEKQGKEIDQINQKLKKQGRNFVVLQGAEANIMPDGSLDIKDEALAKLDYVIAGIHSGLKMNRQQMTKRIIRAMENPYVKMLSHPTGRLLKKRDEYLVNFEEILKNAKKLDIVLEINASPMRLDLNDVKIKRAKEFGVMMSINSDAHHKNQLELIGYGVNQARRGWAERKNIINTLGLKGLKKVLKTKK